MQAEEAPRIRRALPREESLVVKFCREIGAHSSSCKWRIYVLEVPGGRFMDVFHLPPEVEEILARLLGGVAYSAGLYLGKISPEGFTPSLPLAHELARWCGELNCCILTSNGEKRFLYGRTVPASLVASIHMRGTSRKCLVVNARGEALGWGELAKSSKGRRTLAVRPVWDLGWYLRRGG